MEVVSSDGPDYTSYQESETDPSVHELGYD